MTNRVDVVSSGTRTYLKDLMLARYAYLGRNLRRFVYSKEDVADVLQETWLRLEIMPEPGFANGEAYLLGMAKNIAVDQYRRETRHFHGDETDEAFEVEDELADPERIVAARRKIEALERVVRHLPPRRREILLAARIEGELNQKIAERLGISLRLVERELRAALKYCNQCMQGIIAFDTDDTKGRRKY